MSKSTTTYNINKDLKTTLFFKRKINITMYLQLVFNLLKKNKQINRKLWILQNNTYKKRKTLTKSQNIKNFATINCLYFYEYNCYVYILMRWYKSQISYPLQFCDPVTENNANNNKPYLGISKTVKAMFPDATASLFLLQVV